MLCTPILTSRVLNCVGMSSFVNKSANWSDGETWSVLMIPSCNFSWINWQSISICFVPSWYTGFTAMYNAALLSQNNTAGFSCDTLISLSNKRSHMISHVVFTMALYSACAGDHDTIFCFLERQDTSDSPKKAQYPLTDFLISVQDA